jgi:hypothetical protein
MEQIAAKRIELASNAVVIVRIERQVTQNAEMQVQNGFRVGASALAAALCKRLRDSQQTIRNALHRRNYHDNLHELRYRAHQTGGMQHALGAQQRTAAKLKSYE